jgi:hypothetical protein
MRIVIIFCYIFFTFAQKSRKDDEESSLFNVADARVAAFWRGLRPIRQSALARDTSARRSGVPPL